MKPLTHVVAAIIFNEQNEFLISSRPEGKPYAGYWEFAGGKVERGETEFEALKRELYEELNITIHHAHIWLSKIYDYEHATVYLRFFRIYAKDWDSEPQAKEGQKWAWQQAGQYTVSPMLPANAALLRVLAIPTQWCGSISTGLSSPNSPSSFVMPFAQWLQQPHHTHDAHILFTQKQWQMCSTEQKVHYRQQTQGLCWVCIQNQQQFIDSQDADVIMWQVENESSALALLAQLKDGTPMPICAYTNTNITQSHATQWQQYGLHAIIMDSDLPSVA